MNHSLNRVDPYNPMMADVLAKQLGSQCTRADHLMTSLPQTVRAVLGENQWGQPLWRERTDKDTGVVYRFERFSDFVQAAPTAGLGTTPSVLRHFCRHDPVAVEMLEAALASDEGDGRKATANVKSLTDALLGEQPRLPRLEALKVILDRCCEPDVWDAVAEGDPDSTAFLMTECYAPVRDCEEVLTREGQMRPGMLGR